MRKLGDAGGKRGTHRTGVAPLKPALATGLGLEGGAGKRAGSQTDGECADEGRLLL